MNTVVGVVLIGVSMSSDASLVRLTAFGAGVTALFLLNATALGFSLN